MSLELKMHEKTIREYRGSVERDGITVSIEIYIGPDVWVPDHDELSERVTTDAMRLVRQAEAAIEAATEAAKPPPF